MINKVSGTPEDWSLHTILPAWWARSSVKLVMGAARSFYHSSGSLFFNNRRNRQKTICPFFSILPVVALMIISCAPSPDLWYQKGGTQNDFNLDSRECEIIAEQFTLQQSETGKSIDPVNLSQNYLQCINAKGWSRNRPVTEAKTDQPPLPPNPLSIRQNESTLSGFGLHITLPNGFTPVNRQQTSIGPTIMQQFFWKDKSNTFINVIFQQNNKTQFNLSPYPISDAYKLYSAGVVVKAEELLQWSTFFGKIKNEWVMGVGSFYLVSKRERLIIVITKSLDSPSDTPPPNLILSSNQHEQIEAFSNHWVAWLESQFPEKTNWWDRLRKMIHSSP